VLWAASAAPAAAVDLTVPLIPEFDQFGSQIEVVQVYEDADGQRATFGIYDTGASVITLSATDQLYYDLLAQPVPIKVPNGARADAIGNPLIGDVSMPGTVFADGMHAVNLSDLDLLEVGIDLSSAAAVPGVQMFVGNSSGSPSLPTIVGTPIHAPTSRHPDGSAAQINMLGWSLDFGALFPEIPEFQDLVVQLPDLEFVDPGGELTGTADTTAAVRVPLAMYGTSNVAAPGDEVSYAPNPVQPEAALSLDSLTATDQTLLFDTGAQLSVVSPSLAAELGLDPDNPSSWAEGWIDVQGAGGAMGQVPGVVLDSITLPLDDDADGVHDGSLQFTDAWVFMLDFGVDDLDGILGMNLFNTASEMLYDPLDPDGASLSLTFLSDRLEPPSDDDLQALGLLAGAFPAFSGAVGNGLIPGLELGGPAAVPEPGSVVLLLLGMAGMAIFRRPRRTMRKAA
jgi:hypothetical protein